MEYMIEVIEKFSTELIQIAEKTGTVLGEIIPEPITDFTGDILGSFLTVIAPVWNPLWIAINELFDVLFAF